MSIEGYGYTGPSGESVAPSIPTRSRRIPLILAVLFSLSHGDELALLHDSSLRHLSRRASPRSHIGKNPLFKRSFEAYEEAPAKPYGIFAESGDAAKRCFAFRGETTDQARRVFLVIGQVIEPPRFT